MGVIIWFVCVGRSFVLFVGRLLVVVRTTGVTVVRATVTSAERMRDLIPAVLLGKDVLGPRREQDSGTQAVGTRAVGAGMRLQGRVARAVLLRLARFGKTVTMICCCRMERMICRCGI